MGMMCVCVQVCKGPQQHEEVCLGLFALLLTEPPQAQRVRRCFMRSDSHTYHRMLFFSNCSPRTLTLTLCPAVLQGPDVSESGWHERCTHENQPDPYGKVS